MLQALTQCKAGLILWFSLGLTACGGNNDGEHSAAGGGSSLSPSGGNGGEFSMTTAYGNCTVSAAAQAEDTSTPTTIVGDGTPTSCTALALEEAIHAGGIVTFNCGAAPVTISLEHTIQIHNDGGLEENGDVTIDGGNQITLSGKDKIRLLYQNTCDESLTWTTSHCDQQAHPRLVLQNITLAHGQAEATTSQLGGGALYVQGGQLKLFNTTFLNNVLTTLGPDYAGGSIYTTMMAAPVYIVSSRFGGNIAASGGALGSIGTSYMIYNSVFEGNQALGSGMASGNGGNGGAIYNDGNSYSLAICGTLFKNNLAHELGGSIFYVSNNLTGSFSLADSQFTSNSGRGNLASPTGDIYAEVTSKDGGEGIVMVNTTFE